ncbi:MAG: hypothetical protein ABI548_19875 [Polyangiaceae bacterium]
MFASHRSCVVCLIACLAFGCSSKSPPHSGITPGGAAGGAGTDGSAGSVGTGNGTAGASIDVDAGSDPDGGNVVNDLTIMPADPVLQVTVANGVVTSITGGSDAKGTVAFTASSKGSVVAAKWSIDRGELGTLGVSDGSFLPNGNFSGVGLLSALYGKATASTQVTIKLSITQNGGTWDPTTVTPGVGGIGGVGGEAPGGPLDDATRMRFASPGTKPATTAEFGLLYPYDGTVWPRAMLAPLLQWQTKHTPTSAVFVHLSQKNYDFQGFYAGTSVVREHVDQKAWAAATNGNGGDPLHVEVSIADATTVYGPVAQDWIIAPGQLKGTVYYNSYATTLANTVQGGRSPAAILAIKPGRSDPELALPGAKNQCIVCHTVSDDGSTLFAQVATIPNTDDYKNGASYDLTKGGALIQNYTGSSTDGSTNNRKFLWSGLSKDGTYALQSNGPTQEAYGGTASVFRRDTGNAAPAPGFDKQITEIATPAFSRDGKRVAFNYWTGTLAPGGGNGKTLDMMDFTCGDPGTSAAGAPSCSTYTFSSLVRLFTSTGTPGWPAWLPDSSGVVFQNNISGGNPFATWENAKTQLWFVGAPADASMTPMPIAMNALNGDGTDGKSILPVATGVAKHDDDDQMNYEPTVNPIVSGGYAWVVFTSRRMYGNLAQGDPYDSSHGTVAIPKKLWVAAVDLKWTPGKDPSHPAFYLPGQELAAGNMRGYWVVDACQKDGNTCDTGDECCSGYCRPDDSGKLVCGGKPAGCAMEYEKCSSASDCCAVPGSEVECINGFCAVSPPVK